MNLRRIILSLAAGSLAKHGAATRRARHRELVRATARDMRKSLGLKPLKALER